MAQHKTLNSATINVLLFTHLQSTFLHPEILIKMESLDSAISVLAKMTYG